MKNLFFPLFLMYSTFLLGQTDCPITEEVVVCAGVQTDVSFNINENITLAYPNSNNPDVVYDLDNNTITFIPTFDILIPRKATYYVLEYPDLGCQIYYTVLGANSSIIPIQGEFPDFQITSCPGSIEIENLAFDCYTCDYNWTLNGNPHVVDYDIFISPTTFQVDINFLNVTTDIFTPGTHQLCVEVSKPNVACTDQYCFEITIEEFTDDPTFEVIGYDGSICPDQDLYFHNTSGYDASIGTYDWKIIDMMTGQTIFATESLDLIYTFENSGMYSVQLTYSQSDESTSCVSPTTSYTIVVDDDELIEISCPSVICSGSTVTYVADDDGSCTDFTWSSSGPIVSAVDNQDGTYTVVWDNVNEYEVGSVVLESATCATEYCYPTIVDVPIFPTTTQIAGPLQVCTPQELMYNVPDIPGSFYNWTISVLDINGVTTDIPTSETSSTLNVKFNNLPHGTVTISVNIYNPYADCELTASIEVCYPEIVGNVDICLGDPINLDYQIPNGSGITYTISDFSGNVVNGPASIPVSYTPSESGFYYVDFFSGGKECQEPVEIEVIDLQAPIIFGELSICPGEEYTYYIYCAPDESAAWSVTGALSHSYLGSCVLDVVWDPNATLYEISVVKTLDLDGGVECTASSGILNPEVDEPDIFLSGPQSVCYDALSPYSVNDVGGEFYEWTISPASMGSVVSGQGTTNVEIQWLYDPSTTSATVTCVTSVCNQPVTNSLTVDFEDYTLSISDNATICETESASISLFNPTNPFTSWSSISWTVNGIPYPQGDNMKDVTFNFEGPGTYNISADVTNPNSCIQDISLSTVVTVNAAPNMVFAENFYEVCPKSAITDYSLTVVGVDPSTPITWTINTMELTETGTTIILTAADINMAVLVISATATVNGCETTIQADFGWTCVDIPPGCCEENLYIFDFQFSGCNTVAFSGDITNLENQVSNSWSIIYNYELPGSTLNYFLDIENQQENLIKSGEQVFSGPGLYTLILENVCGQNSNGDDCSQEFTREALLPFVQDFTYELVCTANNTYDLRLYDNSEYAELFGVNPSNVYFVWTINGLPISGYGLTYYEYVLGLFPGQTVEVSLSLEHFYNGYTYGPDICPPVVKTIQIPDLPAANFDIDNDFSCLDQILTFTADESQNELASVLWDFDDGSLSRKNPVDKVFTNTGTYNVSLTVTDVNGCTGSNSEELTIIDNAINGTLSYSMEGNCDAMAKLTFTPDSQNPLPIIDYNWSTGDNTGSVNEVMITQSGKYKVTVTDADGCTEIFESDEIFLQDAFASDLIVSNNTCGSKRIFFNVISGYEYLIYSDFNNGESTGFTENTTFFSPGLYDITVYVFDFGPVDENTDLNLACAVDQISFEVILEPSLASLSTGELDCATEAIPVTISNFGNFNLNEVSLTWSGPGLVNVVNEESVLVFSNGTYGVTVKNLTTGCSSTRSITIEKAAPDLSGMITGCYETCEDGDLLIDGILTAPVTVDVGDWSWNLDGNVIQGFSGMSSVPGDLILSDVTFVIGEEHAITFVYTIDGCEFVSEPFCLTVEDCTQDECLVYADGEACGNDPIDCAVSSQDGGPIYFMTMEYLIPTGDDFDPAAPGVNLSYCGFEPFLVDNGTFYVSDVQQIGSNQLNVIGSFTIDDPSMWSGANPVAIQVNYCGDDGNIYCVQYQINPVNCPPNPLECNVWFVGHAAAGPKSPPDVYLAQYCVNLYNINSNGCQSTDWSIEASFEDINGVSMPAFSDMVNIAGQGTVVTYCFDVEVPNNMDFNQVPYIAFNITSNCPNIGCYHRFWRLGTENNSGQPQTLIGVPHDDLANVFSVHLPQEEYSGLDIGTLYFEGKQFEIEKTDGNLLATIEKNSIELGPIQSGVLIYTDNETNLVVKHVNIDISSAITGKEMVVYPNPFSGKLNIETNFTYNTSIKVVDVLGRKIEFEISKVSSDKAQIDLNAQDGLYFINIYEGKRLIGTEKVIKI